MVKEGKWNKKSVRYDGPGTFVVREKKETHGGGDTLVETTVPCNQ